MEKCLRIFRFPLENLALPQRSNKKFRFREDVEKKVKERLRRKKAKSRELVHNGGELDSTKENLQFRE